MYLFSVFGILQNGRYGYSQMAKYDIGNPFFYWIIAIVACIGIITISLVIADSFNCKGLIYIKRALILFGKNSMLIFIIHRTLLYNLKNYYESHNSITICLAMWFILLVYSSVSALIIGKVCPFLAGKYWSDDNK